MGKRNYRFFYSFIISLSFLTSFIFGCVITHITLREYSRSAERNKYHSLVVCCLLFHVIKKYFFSDVLFFSPGSQAGKSLVQAVQESPARYPFIPMLNFYTIAVFISWMRSFQICFLYSNNARFTVDKAFPTSRQPEHKLNRIRELASSKAVFFNRWLSRSRFAASWPCEMMSVARQI